MSEAAAQCGEIPDRRARRASAALLVAVVAATCAAIVVGNGNPALALAPVGAVTLLYAMAKAPLRWSAGALLLLVLSLDMTRDAAGIWHTPLAVVGDLLQENLDRVVGIPGLSVSGLDLVTLYLLVVASRRRAPRAALDGRDRTEGQSAGAIRQFLLLYVAGVAFADLNGAVHGAGFAPYKLRHLLDVPLLFLLFDSAFRGPRDRLLVGRILVFAACAKAVLAIVVQELVAPARTGGKLAHATNHGDSVLFAMAVFILVVDVAERADVRSVRRAALLVPLLVVGMVENNRRTVWVMVAVTLLTAYFLSPWRPWKRTLTRVVLVSAPILALYVGVGWNRDSAIFAPLATFRTLSDGSVDSSTRWREVENYNIAMSMREHPILGIGLGREYTEFMKGDDISAVFAAFKAWPHNSVLGLLLLAGPIAFTAIWSVFGFTVFLAVRAYRRARRAVDRNAALSCVAAVTVCAVLAYSDTGAFHAQYRVLCALALAVAGQLAVATGAWPERRREAGRDEPAALDGGEAARAT